MLKGLRRFADSRSIEGKIISVILVITLALMAWDVNALRFALAEDQPTATEQTAAEKAVEEKAAKEQAV
ncbi:MAG: hypothetical protein Q3963_04745, partial [Coriobacteriaceae bacterium]|nr:hypothetical protein [Coriobacteriaceae bacterium]